MHQVWSVKLSKGILPPAWKALESYRLNEARWVPAGQPGGQELPSFPRIQKRLAADRNLSELSIARYKVGGKES